MLRQTLRSLGRNRGFAFIAVLTLSFGIGATTAMFSLVNGILLKPLAYRDPERLVTISTIIPRLSHLYPDLPVSAYFLTEWRKQARTVDELALVRSGYLRLTGVGDSERLNAVAGSSNLFQMLGVSPQLGRVFLPNEDQPGSSRVVILSDGFWRRRFAGDKNVLGSSIELNGQPSQVIGIMPAGFPFPKGNEVHRMIPMPERTDLWFPLRLPPEETQRLRTNNYAAIARLKPGVPIRSAEAELNGILRRLTEIPKGFESQARLTPLHTEMVARVRQGLIVLMAAIGAVLLIVCVNITNLLLTRGTGRRRELAVRAALGASRLRLCMTLLAESAVLSSLGAAGGILLAYWLLDAVRVHLPVGLPRVDEVALDFTSLLFATAVTVLCAVACGLAPAMRLSGAAPSDALKHGGRGSISGHGVGRLRSGLVAGEVAMCVILLVGAGLLMNSFLRIVGIDQGFRSTNVFVADIDLSGSRYRDPQARAAFFRDAIARTSALPGVQSVGAASKLPLTGVSEVMFILADGDPTPIPNAPQAEYRTATPEYFATMNIPILRGRVFEDRADGPNVAMIGERTAQRIWPGQDPTGRRFKANGDRTLTVVGVVADVRSTVPHSDPPMTVYLPLAQNNLAAMALVVRTAGPEPPIRQALKELDPGIPLSKIAKVDEIVSASTAARRFQLILLSSFAAVALFLACLGIYGVVSFAVAQRRGELGLRMALGAQTRDILSLVFKDGMKPVFIGVGMGLAGSLIVARLISSLLFQVAPIDATTYAVATTILVFVAASACWFPARKAVRIDPNITLRCD